MTTSPDRLRVWAVVCDAGNIHFDPYESKDIYYLRNDAFDREETLVGRSCGPHHVAELVEVRPDKTQWVPAWPGTPARVDEGGDPPDAD